MAFYVKVEDSKKLCYSLEDIRQFDNEQLTAVRQLQIRGLAQMEKRMIDGKTELVYAVGGMQPLSQYLSTGGNRAGEQEEFSRILQKALRLMQEVEKYPLLSVANMVLDLEYLWIDARGELFGIYLPLMQDYQNLSSAWKKLIQDLLGRAESDAGLLFLTKQLRLVENMSVFSVAEIQRQILTESQSGGQTGGWQASPVPSAGASFHQPERNSSQMNPQMNSPINPQMNSPVNRQMQQPPQSFKQPPVADIPAQGQAPLPPKGRNEKQPPSPNIQMMQAPNQSYGQPPHSANPKMPQSQSKPKTGKWNVPMLIIGHAVIVLIAVAMIFTGILKNEEGGLDIINVALLLVIVLGGLAVTWLKIGVAKSDGTTSAGQSKPVKQPKQPKQPQQKSGQSGKVPGIADPSAGVPGMNLPGMANQPGKSQPVIPPQPERRPQPVSPINQPPQPQMQPQPPVQSLHDGQMIPEAEGTMIMGVPAMSHSDGTVVFEQESGAFLSLKSGADKRKIVKNPFRIGRNADWKLSDSAVSGMHCQVEMQDGKYYLVDIGSKNGTFLNGRRLEANQYQPLSHGDEIKLGNTEIVFEVF